MPSIKALIPGALATFNTWPNVGGHRHCGYRNTKTIGEVQAALVIGDKVVRGFGEWWSILNIESAPNVLNYGESMFV